VYKKVMDIQTLISDIYSYMNGAGDEHPDRDRIIDEFKEECANIARRFTEERTAPRQFRLRPSNMGHPIRKLWFQANTPMPEANERSHLPLTFMFGSLTEAMLLCVAKLTGKHEITDQQKTVGLGGIEGSIDAVIDGALVDVKSASPYSFNLVRNGSLTSSNPEDDPWGYRDQASFYSRADGRDKFYWLTFDKSSGELALTGFDALTGMKSRKALEDQITRTNEILKQPSPPTELCYQPVPDGKSGNETLHKLCSMCPFKMACFPHVRVFKYATGLKYLTKVNRTPDVEEVTNQQWQPNIKSD